MITLCGICISINDLYLNDKYKKFRELYMKFDNTNSVEDILNDKEKIAVFIDNNSELYVEYDNDNFYIGLDIKIMYEEETIDHFKNDVFDYITNQLMININLNDIDWFSIQ